jgi:peptidoglycan/xylan/chitin deacetylase (PgdA/CDA1 family)
MFFVFNKQKIYTYVVSLVTVVFLFCVASSLNQSNRDTVQTSTTNQKRLPIYNVETTENKVALTMNCAWNADDIDSILETLKNNDTKITFFMVGDWIEKFPDAVKKISEAGHEIASHSDTHPHVNNLSYEENIEEIEKSNEKIEKITGSRTDIYRPPYGEYNDTVIKAAEDKGYYCIQWNLDTLDYTGLTSDEMWNRLKDKLKSGDIILTHNGTEHTADSLDQIIKNIKAKGLEVVRISDLIYKDEYTINHNGTQIKNK